MLSRPLNAVVESMDNTLLPHARAFELALLSAVEWLITRFTCITAFRRYNRPVRPAEWPQFDELGSIFKPFCPFWFDKWDDGTKVGRGSPVEHALGKVSVNSKAELSPQVRWAVEAWKLLGGPVEYLEHEFGLIWITLPDEVNVILGQAEIQDAKRHKHKLASTHSNDAGARLLYLHGWHDGPYVKKEGERLGNLDFQKRRPQNFGAGWL